MINVLSEAAKMLFPALPSPWQGKPSVGKWNLKFMYMSRFLYQNASNSAPQWSDVLFLKTQTNPPKIETLKPPKLKKQTNNELNLEVNESSPLGLRRLRTLPDYVKSCKDGQIKPSFLRHLQILPVSYVLH